MHPVHACLCLAWGCWCLPPLFFRHEQRRHATVWRLLHRILIIATHSYRHTYIHTYIHICSTALTLAFASRFSFSSPLPPRVTRASEAPTRTCGFYLESEHDIGHICESLGGTAPESSQDTDDAFCHAQLDFGCESAVDLHRRLPNRLFLHTAHVVAHAVKSCESDALSTNDRWFST
jgi:hypothetical protein